MNKITYLELASIVIIELISLNLGINSAIVKSTLHNSWLVAIIAYLIGIIPLVLTLYIANYQKDLPINKKITHLFGNILGKIINIILAITFFIIAITILYNINIFTSSQFLYRTPAILVTIILVLLIIYNTNKGLNTITRTNQLLATISLILFIISSLSLIKEIDLSYFLPILKENTTSILPTSLKLATIYTLPLISILCIPKNQITRPDKYNKTIIISYIIGFLILLITILSTYGILGDHLVNLFEFPEYAVLKKVKLFGFLERIENIISLMWFIANYAYISIMFYNISTSITNNTKTYKISNLLIGLIAITTTRLFFKNNIIFINYLKNLYPYLLIPLFIIYLLVSLKIFIKKKKSAII